MSDCIFCKIINGEIPSRKLYEDDEFIAILDAFPSAAGHLLVIPKVHAENIFTLDPETTGRAFVLAGKLAERLKSRLGCEAVNILQNNGEAAGQTVMHFHIHAIPRRKDDGTTIRWKTANLSDAETAEVFKKLN